MAAVLQPRFQPAASQCSVLNAEMTSSVLPHDGTKTHMCVQASCLRLQLHTQILLFSPVVQDI